MAHRTLSLHPKPDVSGGIEYWQTVEANVNGVLGGYGLGTLPRVDALGSRLFLLSLLPRLSTIPDVTQDPKVWREQRAKRGGRRTRALDAGAGVGRVTRDVLGLLLDEVHLVEPVRKFLVQAATEAPTWPSLQTAPSSSTSSPTQPKSVHFHISTLHALDPARPWSTSDGGIFLNPNGSAMAAIFLNPNGSAMAANGGGRNKRAKVDDKEKKLAGQGAEGGSDAALIPPVTAPSADAKSKSSASAPDVEVKSESSTTAAPPASAALESPEAEPLQYDVIWCQWMLQHLSDPDLISFLHRAKAALVKNVRPAPSQEGGDEEEEEAKAKEEEPQDGVIVVKENVCTENEDGSENVWWDEEDKSITRSSKAYERVFREAGLEVVRCEVQEGLPEELFVVKMWAL
ncbi:hypothetical protein BCV69DRAFT_281755, partial [Microstroma glucosiphilum]